jgi:hypothetical protein
MDPELGATDVERHARPRARFLEDDRDRMPRELANTRTARLFFQLRRKRKDFARLVQRQIAHP